MRNSRQNYGFTIVELLIVIVVVGILAAISIVAYNGIQQRASNTITSDATMQFIKAYGLYGIEHGSYPASTGCLGEGYPANRCLSQNGTNACFGMGASGPATAANTALREYMGGNLPSPSMQAIPCGGTTYIGIYAWYNSANGRVTVHNVLNGDVPCPPMSPNVISTSKAVTEGATRCAYLLEAPRT